MLIYLSSTLREKRFNPGMEDGLARQRVTHPTLSPTTDSPTIPSFSTLGKIRGFIVSCRGTLQRALTFTGWRCVIHRSSCFHGLETRATLSPPAASYGVPGFAWFIFWIASFRFRSTPGSRLPFWIAV